MDTDGDGFTDEALLDTDFDGIGDTKVYDHDGDGVYESAEETYTEDIAPTFDDLLGGAGDSAAAGNDGADLA